MTRARTRAAVLLLVAAAGSAGSAAFGESPAMSEFWYESGGTKLYAVEAGAGSVVVMLHGGMASHVGSLPLVLPLADRYRVVTPDLRGSGRSVCADPLTFERLSDDLVALLDHLDVRRAVVGGVSQGSGVAVHFALHHPERVAGLVVLQPIYAGTHRGYTAEQQEPLTRMDALASRAPAEGVGVLRPLYEALPERMREKALEMLEGFDPASVAATSHFVASGVQPFDSASELQALSMPTLLVRGDDAMHPASVSDLYAESLPHPTVLPASTGDVASAIGEFCESLASLRGPQKR